MKNNKVTDNKLKNLRESDYKTEITLVAAKNALKRILMDYEQNIREHSDPTFDIYDYLFNELGEGYSEANVRRWPTHGNTDFPKPNQLLTISKQLNTRHAIDATIEYLKYHAEGLR